MPPDTLTDVVATAVLPEAVELMQMRRTLAKVVDRLNMSIHGQAENFDARNVGYLTAIVEAATEALWNVVVVAKCHMNCPAAADAIDRDRNES